MKKILLFAVTTIILLSAQAQSKNPVTWSFSSKHVKDDLYEVHLKATIASAWHIYAQATPKGGPVASKLTFNAHPLLKLEGNTKEVGRPVSKFEEVFGVNVIYFNGGVDFVQLVHKKSKVKTKINGTIEYMVCNDTQCLPPTKTPFSITLN